MKHRPFIFSVRWIYFVFDLARESNRRRVQHKYDGVFVCWRFAPDHYSGNPVRQVRPDGQNSVDQVVPE